jgi:omega-hydroxy-beta-dihydromenaquinone-9 sulfotransferase
MWEGFGFLGWTRFLLRNRFAVHPRYWWVAAIVMVVSTIHSICWLIQETFWRHRITRAPAPIEPVFILGHWRTGTTFLHELLIRDPRHAFPNTYQCMEPNCFLLVEGFMKRFMPFLVPKRRPMDDLPIGWDRPQEDEFALCMMGQPSFYTHIGFPNRRPADFDALDFRGISEQSRRRWSRALAWFLHRVAFLHPGKRLVLKSPPHMARIPALLRQFPNARFVYITRNPYRVYASTVRLWKALSANHALQVSHLRNVDDIVVEAGQRMYAAYQVNKKLIPPGRLFELRYEDLMFDPIGQMQELYRTLGLGDFAQARTQVEEFLACHQNYKPNNGPVSDNVKAKVDRHWSEWVREFKASNEMIFSAIAG